MKTTASAVKNVLLITGLCLTTIQLQSQTNASHVPKATAAKPGAPGLGAGGSEVRLSNPHPSGWPFPNYQTSTGRARPNYLNFYRMDDRFPAYLLCEYDVKESSYRSADETEWFKASLGQIRRSGPQKFPRIQWVAVAIHNVADQKGTSPFEGSFKVGVIFKASDVFDSSRSLSELVAHVPVDRHPFKYDAHSLTPEGRERWIIVEQHAAANRPATGPN